MPRVERSITINVPVEKAYALIADAPERMAEWWPPIELQERVSPPPTALGSVSRYVYNMMGVKIKGEHLVQSIRRNEYLSVKTLSGIDSTFDFSFSPSNNGEVNTATRLTIAVDYQLPGAIIGQLINKTLIEGENIQNLEKGLENLKGILERENTPEQKPQPNQ